MHGISLPFFTMTFNGLQQASHLTSPSKSSATVGYSLDSPQAGQVILIFTSYCDDRLYLLD
jgi:hypothetical protein